MRKLTYLYLFLAGVFIVGACSDGETYADQKKRERSAISKYLADSAVTVITEDQFKAQDSTTDVSRKEWVLFESSGVYMQVIRKGCGGKIRSGETVTLLCRFTERNLLTDSIQLSNTLYGGLDRYVEKMSVTNNSGTFRASFLNTSPDFSIMSAAYGSTSVPQGWLLPLTFINVGRPAKATDEIAKVRLIVPHDQGQLYASQSVYPCLYDITFERGR